jgi:hypothetical protein
MASPEPDMLITATSQRQMGRAPSAGAEDGAAAPHRRARPGKATDNKEVHEYSNAIGRERPRQTAADQ